MLIDFHVHSAHTPGSGLSLPEIISRAKEAGLDGFCLTDLHTVAGCSEARQLADQAGLRVFTGFEAHTENGHFLVFVPEPLGLPEISLWLRFDPEGRVAYDSLLKAVEERNGILIAAHPYDRSLRDSPGDALVQLPGVSAVEVLNGRRPLLANDLAEEVAAGVGLPGVGGSDARSSREEIGGVATLLCGTVSSEAELIERVRAGDVWPVSIGRLAVSLTEDEPRPRRERSESRDRAAGPRDDRRGRERRPRERGERGRGRDRDRDRKGGERGDRQRRSRPPRPPKS